MEVCWKTVHLCLFRDLKLQWAISKDRISLLSLVSMHTICGPHLLERMKRDPEKLQTSFFSHWPCTLQAASSALHCLAPCHRLQTHSCQTWCSSSVSVSALDPSVPHLGQLVLLASPLYKTHRENWMPAALAAVRLYQPQASWECKHRNLCHVLGRGESLMALHSSGSTRSSTVPHQWDKYSRGQTEVGSGGAALCAGAGPSRSCSSRPAQAEKH